MKIYTKISNKIFFYGLLFYSLIGIIPSASPTIYYFKSIIIPIFSILYLAKNRKNKIHKELLFLISTYVCLLIFSALQSSVSINLIALFLEFIPPLILLCYLCKKIQNRDIFNLLISVHYLSSFFALMQFFILPQYVMTLSGVWLEVSSELPLLMKRSGSIFGNPNVFGAYNVLVLIIILYQKQLNRPSKEVVLIQILAILNIVLIAKSRSSLFTIYFIYLFFFLKENRLLFFTALLAIPAFVLSLINIILSIEELDQIFRLSELFLSERNSFSIRKEIFEFSFGIIQNNFLLGVGPGNILPFFQSLDAPHNGPETAGMWIIIEKGVINYIIYILLIVKMFFSRNSFKIILASSVLIIGVFETVFVQSQLLGVILILSHLNIKENVIQQR